MFEGIREDIDSFFKRDPAARNRLDILLNYPGLHALLMHRLSHWLWKRHFFLLGRMISTFSRFLTGIEIHPGAIIGRRFFIDHGMGVVIGETAEVGDDVTLYHGVTLGGTSWEKGKRHPTLRDGVVVGAGAKILGPFVVGHYAKVGSNAVVTKPVPDGCTVVGNPGRIIPPRGEDQSDDPDHFAHYGITPDSPDPVAASIIQLLRHIQGMDKQMEVICRTFESQGIPCEMGQNEEMSPECFQELGARLADLMSDPERQRHKT
jgi:serine O-acetyltransferase